MSRVVLTCAQVREGRLERPARAGFVRVDSSCLSCMDRTGIRLLLILVVTLPAPVMGPRLVRNQRRENLLLLILLAACVASSDGRSTGLLRTRT